MTSPVVPVRAGEAGDRPLGRYGRLRRRVVATWRALGWRVVSRAGHDLVLRENPHSGWDIRRSTGPYNGYVQLWPRGRDDTW